ncbi:uncharacterized protein LOC101776386 [Setaria italica]|uniref:uncharacterized protein LOC101776386 n=1 Tax=Setaria italica TaxID=4555 RepID=UPI000645CE90|nr:uncharacterized protein LOC101776386 [Setaria italica]
MLEVMLQQMRVPVVCHRRLLRPVDGAVAHRADPRRRHAGGDERDVGGARLLLEGSISSGGGRTWKKSYYPITLWTIEKSLHENAPLTYLKFVQSTFRNVVSDEFLFQKKGSQMNSHLTNCWLYAAVFVQHRHLASLLSVACL